MMKKTFAFSVFYLIITIIGLNTHVLQANDVCTSASEIEAWKSLGCDSTDMCEYTFELSVSNSGMTWNGSALEVYQNDSLINTFTLPQNQTEATYSCYVCNGANLKIEFSSPFSFAYIMNRYIIFTIFDANGMEVYQCHTGDAASWADGDVIYTGVSSCTTLSCTRPENVTVIEHVHSAEISWVDDSESSQSWIIEYDTMGFTPGTGTMELAYSSPYTIMDLDSNTDYDVYVRTFCGEGDTSVRTNIVTFTTPLCELEDQCEYVFNMHSSSGYGWTYSAIEIYSNGDYVTWITLDDGYSASIPISLCDGAEISLKWIAGWYPEEISFNITNSYYGDTIYSCSTGADLTNNATFYTFTANCSQPECAKPTAVSATNISETTADLWWTEMGDASIWIIEYDTMGFTPGTGHKQTVYTNPFTLTGLTADTFYDVYVQALCSVSDTSMQSEVYTFGTACGTIDTLPYFENFDSANVVVNGFPRCWVRHTSNPDYFVHIPSAALSAYSMPKALDFNYTPDCSVIAVMQPITESIPVSNLTVNFMAYTDYKDAGLREIGVMTDPYDTTTFESVAVILLTENHSWQEFEILMSEYAGEGQYIAFRYSNAGNTHFLIDDISINTTQICIAPNNLMVTDIDATSAEIHWTERGNATAWEVKYSAEDNPSDSTILQAMDTFIVLTNLNVNTMYNVCVRSICYDDNRSVWSNPITFSTTCLPEAIPFSCNFDSEPAGVDFIECWTRIGDYPQIAEEAAFSGTKSLHCLIYPLPGEACYAALPTIDKAINPINTLQLSFYARKAYNQETDQGRIIVGVTTDPTDINTFVAIDTIDCPSINYEEYTTSFENYQGDGSYVTLKFPKGTDGFLFNDCYLDDIYLETITICSRPTAFHATNATTNSITLEWTENGNANEWEIKYGNPGFNVETAGSNVTATSNPFTVTGLTANTTYDFYVRANCSSDNHSQWSNVYTYTTACLPITDFPFTEDFENNGLMPDCWSQEHVSNNQNWEFTTGNGDPYGNFNEAHDGTYNALLQLTTAGSSTTKLITPILDLTNVSDPYVSFWHSQPQWSADLDELKVYYRPNATAEWTELADYTYEIPVWTKESITLPNPSATYQIAFEGTAQHGYGILLDDITVAAYIPCNAPTGLNITTATTTATATWNETGTFDIAYKKTTETSWSDNITVNDNTYTLQDLTPNTTYILKVRQNCGTNTSDWVSRNFLTQEEEPEVCPMPTNLTTSNITNNSVTLSWNQEGDVNAWTLKYRKTNDESWVTATINNNPYTMTDLLGNTAYEVQIRANCNNGQVSEYTTPITFTTTNIGINDYTFNNCFTLYPNPTTSYIDVKINNDVQVSEIQVYDVYGKLLQVIKVTENPVRIHVADLAKGVYFVKAISEDRVATKSFIRK